MAALCSISLLASQLAVAQPKIETKKRAAAVAQEKQDKASPPESREFQCKMQATKKKLKGEERNKFMSTCAKG
jgi:hypothetical protein